MIRRLANVGAIVAVLVFWAATAFAAPTITGVRIGQHDSGKTRFVLDLDEALEYSIFTLANPNRVVIDLPELHWAAPQGDAVSGKGLIDRFRVGLFRPGVFRVVLDVNETLSVDRAFVLKPQGPFAYRLVLDLKPIDPATFNAGVGRRGSVPFTPIGAPSIPRAPAQPSGDQRPTIVIDAGHGGIDPGAVSPNRRYEKDITLAVAKALKRELDRSGDYNAILTRDRDIFLQLRERVAIARAAEADLFISVHVDTLSRRSVRGASVYTLSETASDQEAAALAAKENKSDIIAGIDLDVEDQEVASILIDLAQRESMNNSGIFAGGLATELARSVRVLRNTHRYAGFRVLKAPDVPSVLIELGYLSNAEDEAMLRSASGQIRISKAIVRAVDTYFSDFER